MEPDAPEATIPETDDLTTVRDLILRAHPDVVPELVTGGTIAELTAAIEPARAAYQRISDGVRSQESLEGKPDQFGARSRASPTTSETPPTVPAGGAPMVVDLDRLPTAELLRRGVEQRGR
ncbi:MAG: hypothetical protein ACRDJW_07600 [Thermomicrobiales bacterium]